MKVILVVHISNESMYLLVDQQSPSLAFTQQSVIRHGLVHISGIILRDVVNPVWSVWFTQSQRFKNYSAFQSVDYMYINYLTNTMMYCHSVRVCRNHTYIFVMFLQILLNKLTYICFCTFSNARVFMLKGAQLAPIGIAAPL